MTEEIRTPILMGFDQVEPEAITWTWKPMIPRRKITILEGDPEAGKTFVALAIADRENNDGNLCPLTKARTDLNSIHIGQAQVEDDKVRLSSGSQRQAIFERFHALVTAVTPTSATVKVGRYHATITPQDAAWTQKRLPELFKLGDICYVKVLSLGNNGVAHVSPAATRRSCSRLTKTS